MYGAYYEKCILMAVAYAFSRGSYTIVRAYILDEFCHRFTIIMKDDKFVDIFSDDDLLTFNIKASAIRSKVLMLSDSY